MDPQRVDFSIPPYFSGESVQEIENLPIQQVHREALNRCFPNFSYKLTPLLGGNSSKLFLIDLPSERYVLRIKEEADSTAFERELFAMREAAKIGIGPSVIAAFPKEKMLIMEYIDESTLTIEKSKCKETCEKVANALRKAHSIPQNPHHGLSRNEVMEVFFQALQQYPSIVAEAEKAIAVIRRGSAMLSGELSSQAVNTHSDLNPGNIFITSNSALFIDWEGTNWEDPFYDLSYFAAFHDYNEKMQRYLITSYLQRDPSEEELKRYATAKQVTFARIATSCYFISFVNKLEGKTETLSSELQEWEHYITALANKSYADLSPSQFFYDMARVALKNALAL